MDGATLKALTRELFQLKTEEPEGIKVTINEEKLTEFTVTMDGPGNSVLMCVYEFNHVIHNRRNTLSRRAV